MKKIFKLFCIIALSAIIGFSFAACDKGGDVNTGIGADIDDNIDIDSNTDIDTTALDAVILEARNARDGVEKASVASEVPAGKKWVTESEWNAFDAVFKTAAETKANPLSQSAVNTAKTNLQTALDAFNAAKKDGSAASITLSGTITIKNNGQIVPYVRITARTHDWQWQESVKIPATEPNSSWAIILKPFSSLTNIIFTIAGYDNDKYENDLFSYTVDGLNRDVYQTDITGITINLENLRLITISGTLNLDYDGREIPSMEISIDRKEEDLRLGFVRIYKAGNNTPWSIVIEARENDTAVTFNIAGFDGPIPWEYDTLFGLWKKDFGIKVGNQDKSDIALNLITISGTLSVTYDENPVPIVEVNILESGSWIANTTLISPSANTPWTVVIPAFTDDTEITINIVGRNVENGPSLFGTNAANIPVKNINVSGIELNPGNFPE